MAAGNDYVDKVSNCYTGSSGNYYGNAGFSEIETTPYTIVVGALNASGVVSSYSSPGANLLVSAPGGEYGLEQTLSDHPTATQPALIAADFVGCSLGIKSFSSVYSNFDRGLYGNSGCRYTSTMNGTSGATPLVTGAVALMLQANPALTWRDVKYILLKTADQVDSAINPAHHPDPSLDLSGYTYEQGWITNAAGFHFQNFYGFGRINVDAAVTLAKNYVSALGTYSETGWVLYDTGAISVAVPDATAAGATKTMNVISTMTVEAVRAEIFLSGCVGDIGLELSSPSGTKSILKNINSGLLDATMAGQIFMSNAFYGEPTLGTWTLRAIDGHAGCTANLTQLKLNFSGY
jgi:subtilisin family serine protease